MSFKASKSGYLYRNANVPADSACTICGWFISVTDSSYNRALMALDGSSGTVDIYRATTGTIQVWIDGSNITFSSSPNTTEPFFAAIVFSGTTVYGRWRGAGSSTFVTSSGTIGTSGTRNAVCVGATRQFGNTEIDGSAWNIKCWDRALSDDELMVESFYRAPQFPSSLNFWWPLDVSTDLTDKGPNGRNPTTSGSYSTGDSSHGLWSRATQSWPLVAGAAPSYVFNPLTGRGGGAARPLVQMRE